MKIIIGIVGKAKSGKTYAGNFFTKLGGTFIDCDKITTELYKKGNIGAKKIETFFGDEFLKDGAVNRSKLGRFVAKDEKKLRILEKIIHPVILSEVQKQIDQAKSQPIFIEINAPSEKFLKLCSKIILIESPQKTRTEKIKTEYLSRIDKFKQLPTPNVTIKNTYDKKTFESKLKNAYNQAIHHKP